MVTNYLAPVLTEGSLTHWMEDDQSSLVGSVENFDMQPHVGSVRYGAGRGGFSLARPRPYTGPGGVFLG